MKRAEWLASLKPGDAVGVFEPLAWDPEYAVVGVVTKVNRQTIWVRIGALSHSRFDRAEGRAFAAFEPNFSMKLIPVTDTLREMIEHRALLSQLHARLGSQDVRTLRDILELLRDSR